ncbi:hypothetical protein [Streptomyces lasiicapitis]|uniref:hypothetical protein n=1 Tax=Streptomyces lasiicapitis TaxID=1923961 RepID=UPI00331B7E8F
MPEHAQMTVEEFEHLEKHAPDTVKLEFIRGKLKVKPMPDQRHRAIVMWLLTQCMQQRPELLLYPEQDLQAETYRNGRAYADGALVVFSEPMNGAYQRCPSYPFGNTVQLPAPVNITLETEKLKDYSN